MPDVRMPDGTIIRNVPEGTTKSQLQARYAKAKTGDTSSAYNKSNVSQGLSGMNEGVADILGAPVDLANSVLDLGARGVNAVAGTNLRMPAKPFLGSDMIADTMRKAGSIGPATVAPDNRFVRRTMRSVGSAMVPVAAVATKPMQIARAALPAVTGGMGAATAQQMFPGNPIAELGGELLGSGAGLTSAYRSMKKVAGRKAAAAVPTIPQLKTRARDLYDKAEANGVMASQELTGDLHNRFKTIAQDEGLVSPTGRVSSAYPKAKEALELSADYATGTMSPKQMKTVRKILSEAASSNDNSERRLARMMLGEFDDWAAPLAPEFAQARQVSSRYINSQKLQEAMEQARRRAGQFSDSGYENALRTEFRGLDRKIVNGQERGFNEATQKAIREVSRGTTASNIARNVGRLAPNGLVGVGIGTGVPFAIGNAIGGPGMGAGLSAAARGVGEIGRRNATKMTINSADMADLIARNGKALEAAPILSPEDQAWITALLSGQLAPKVARKKEEK